MFLTKRSMILIIYIICVYIFGIFVRYLEYSEFFLCYNCEEVDNPDVSFDYIVVGCGSAGSILAKRLAEDKNNKILILEAGKNGNPILDIPAFGLLLQQTPFDWQYVTVPQKTCLSLHNNTSKWPMGRMVGGTSMLNNMIYVRGHPGDFNEWFKELQGYTFEENVMPYFKKLEESIYISNTTFKTELSSYIINAAKELQFDVTEHTEDCTEGFGFPKVNLFKGQRWTSAHSLLEKSQSNVVLRTNRVVERVLFYDDFEAYGVEYKYLDDVYVAKASKGVILSAGTIGSPKILLKSGIGPKQDLHNSKLNLPVGKNLQDHLTTGFDLVLLKNPLGIGIEQILSPYSAVDYFRNGNGPWTTGGCEVLAHLKLNSKSKYPDLQFMVMNLGLNEDSGIHLRKLIGVTDETWEGYFSRLNDTITATILPVLLHPKSRGTIRLDDRNEVVIDPNYLSNSYDVDMLVRGIELVRKLVESRTMQAFGARFNTNVLPPCRQFPFGSKKYWCCYIKHLTITSYHPVGTCKMGHVKDESAVVGYDFKVRGANNLFVVDASVIPSLTSGNINGAVLMLGEMASDVIKNIDFLTKGSCRLVEVFIKNKICKI